MNAKRSTWLVAALLVAAACAAYANSFGVPFLFDDQPSVFDNLSIRSWRTAFFPPNGYGFTVSGRPLLNFTLAVNYAWGQFDVASYHVVNLAIHAAAALVLFGLVRRTLRSPSLAPRFGANADGAAFATALLWLLHPLQTEAVTYIIQRAESLMALMFLLTLYCFARATAVCHLLNDKQDFPSDGEKTVCHLIDDKPSGRETKWWSVATVVSCLLGVACKEVIAVAPVLVLLYDRTFVAGGFRAAWRRRRGLYAALFATWLPLLFLIASVGGDRGGTFKFTAEAIGRQWRGQCEAILVYVKLAGWPEPLAIDYGPLHVSDLRLVLCGAAVAALLGATIWAVRRGWAAGFCGAWVFLILAPTSVMPGVVQTIVEHRMYLPLAAVLALAVGGAVAGAGRRAILVVLVLAVGEGVLTARRNADYQDDFALWRDTVAKRPGSALAQNGLGTAYFVRKKYSEALACYRAALRIDPGSAKALFNEGQAFEALGRPAEALPCYQDAARLLVRFPQAHARIGAILESQGKLDEAETHLRAAIATLPDLAEAHNALGLVLSDRGKFSEAIACYRAALSALPTDAEAECNWGAAAQRIGRPEEARAHLRRAIELRPTFAEAYFNLGLVATQGGQNDEARSDYAAAVRINPDYGEARLNLGIEFARLGRMTDALEQLQAGVRLMPRRPQAHANLAIILGELGRLDEAVASYETALRLQPDYAQAHYNFGNTLLQLRRWSEARNHFAEAVRLAPDFAAAREMLDRLNSDSRSP